MVRAGASFDRPTIEVADILRRHGEAYLRDHVGHVGRTEQRVMSAITACRTAALGGHVEACDDCGATRVAYNSCRNRHCPKCQGAARERWLAERQAELLPVPYFHIAFTLPAPIAAMAFQKKGDVYAILFKSAVEAMTTLAANPRRLGAKIGGLAILHTWGADLKGDRGGRGATGGNIQRISVKWRCISTIHDLDSVAGLHEVRGRLEELAKGAF